MLLVNIGMLFLLRNHLFNHSEKIQRQGSKFSLLKLEECVQTTRDLILCRQNFMNAARMMNIWYR